MTIHSTSTATVDVGMQVNMDSPPRMVTSTSGFIVAKYRSTQSKVEGGKNKLEQLYTTAVIEPGSYLEMPLIVVVSVLEMPTVGPELF